MTPPDAPRRRKLAMAFVAVVGLVGLNYAPVAWGSVFGEENVTLVELLAQTFHVVDEMKTLNETADLTAEVITDVRDTYAHVNAGIDELQSYSFDRFAADFKKDLYHTYPGFAHLDVASDHLKFWDDTHGHSPWTAYEAVTAVAGDLSDLLRKDVRDGRANVDSELILHGEGAGSLALAAQAEDATERFDEDAAELARFAAEASPGQAAQLTAKAQVLIAAQNSHIIRLLSRGVRLKGVDMVLDYKDRIEQRNDAYDDRFDTSALVRQAARPPQMFDVGGLPAEDLE